jgi:CDP-paratose 2-epimerase
LRRSRSRKRPRTGRFLDENREGDHIWWISDTRRFQDDYPEWRHGYDLTTTINEIVEATKEKFVREAKYELAAA